MRRNIYAFIIILLMLLLFGCEKATEPKTLSLTDAEKAIYSNVLNNSDSGRVVYELQNILKAGSIISCRQLDSTDFIVPSDSWFFFIDDAPQMYWVHPCRYVFVDASTAKLTIYNWTYRPTCLGEMKNVKF